VAGDGGGDLVHPVALQQGLRHQSRRTDSRWLPCYTAGTGSVPPAGEAAAAGRLPEETIIARERDETKRAAILGEAKRQFAVRGFHAASLADIMAPLGLPVGSVYTYFQSKEHLIRCIIEEGWAEFWDELQEACTAAPDAEWRLALIIDRFLPALLRDTDLISLFMTVGLPYTSLDAKLASLTGLLGGLLAEVASRRGLSPSLEPRLVAPALTVFLLGCIDAVRLGRATSLPLAEADILDFVRQTVEHALGCKLPAIGGSTESLPRQPQIAGTAPDGSLDQGAKQADQAL